MYRFRVLDFDGKMLSDEQIPMVDIISRAHDVMPLEVQSKVTVHNHLTSKGYYARAGADAAGLHVIIIVTPV